MNETFRLTVKVKEIRGKCPVFKLGDKIVVEEPEILVKETDALCVHALGSMLSMIVPLSRGISFKTLGLAKEDENIGYVQCLDPSFPYTAGGTVIFEIKREKK
ncbi:MAG: TIGR04076 family protein [Candidatus Bathyarchaeia archaeon]